MKILKMTKQDNENIKKDDRFIFYKNITNNIYNYDYSYIAVENNEIVGFIYAVKIMGQRTVLILAINTRNDRYGQGIGKELLLFLENKLKEDNIKSIMLFYEESSKLNAFYKENGFEMGNNMRAIIKEL